MWGGRYNPILPVDTPQLATALASLFRVDALVPLSKGAAVDAFLAAHKYLPWPFMHDGLFSSSMGDGKVPAIVDISHPVMRTYNESIKNNPNAAPMVDIYNWEPADPLADVFLCTYGTFPSATETGSDYLALIQTSLHGVGKAIQNGGEVHIRQMGRDTIATLNRAYLERHYAVQNHWDWPGFYVGDSDNFDDLVNFWNLRAADIQMVFFDARYADRSRAFAEQWAGAVRQAPTRSGRPKTLALWHREDRSNDDGKQFFGDDGLLSCPVDEAIWNGSNVRAPIMHFGDATALASIDESGRTPSMSFTLTNKPFVTDLDAHSQHYVLSIEPGIGLFRNEHATLHSPFVPELNEFYGRNAYFIWNAARSEPESLGIISSVSDDHTTLHGLSVNKLITEIFGVVGIEATPSKPGLIAATLIRQMGGLDGCRPFKIAGVRTLIERHKPQQSFDRGTAMQIIRGQGNDRPLSEYQWLYIEPRKAGSELKNSSVLAYLLEKGVFRAGLKFDCPSCRLEFWRSLDDARARLECDYCGNSFNAAPQLSDKKWAFRRSGLFGNDDHQEGAIPVLLALQQLMRMHSTNHTIYTTAMTLRSKGARISDCETDFVVVAERGRDHRIQIVVGEAKTRQRITSNDVEKLKAVADAFPSDRYDVYVVFARLTPFSPEEIDLIKQIDIAHRRRIIMLTDRELEPYFVYERTAKDFDIQRTAVSFEDMARATVRVFFEQRQRTSGLAKT